jgi:SAM-dependent methyltransferase
VEPGTRGEPAGRLDTGTPNVARMSHHYLGGRETFQADRDAAERTLAALPHLRTSVLAARAFATRAVRFLAGEASLGQFLEIGVGLPLNDAVHEVAYQANPAAKVAYVDYDPVVVSRGNALLARPGLSIVVQADLRDPERLLALPELRAHLDFGQPVAVLIVAVMHFVADEDRPHEIVAAIRDAVAPGSYLVLSHLGIDLVEDKVAVRRALAAYEKSSASLWPRTREQVLRFFDGFDLVEPGLVPKPQWRPVPGEWAGDSHDVGWCGVGRKPE